MNTLENPFAELFTALALGLFIPVSAFDVTFTSVSSASILVIIVYVVFIAVIAIRGYRITLSIAPISYGATAFWFTLHRTAITGREPDYAIGLLIFCGFIVLALLLDRVRITFWLATLGALVGVYVARFVGLEAFSSIGALIGGVVGTVISRQQRIYRLADLTFSVIAALVSAAIAAVCLMFLFNGVASNIPQLQGFQFPTILVLGASAFWQIWRIRRLHLEKIKPAASLTLESAAEVIQPSPIRRWAGVVALIVQGVFVLYLTLNINSVRDTFVLPLPDSVQAFMDDFSTYTNVNDESEPFLYVAPAEGVDVYSCPQTSCTIIAHYPQGRRLETITLVDIATDNATTTWVEVLDVWRIGFVERSLTTDEPPPAS